MKEEESNIQINWSGYLTLVRHGETSYNVENRFVGISDIPLNKNGINQAKKTAKYLFDWCIENKKDFSCIFSSPLKRCVQTAEQIENLLELPINKEPLLIERNYGVFEGLSQREAAKKHVELYQEYKKNKPFVYLPQGESCYEVEDRLKQFLSVKIPNMCLDHSEIIIVSHLNPIRAILRLFGLVDWDIYFKPFNNASVTRIRIENGVANFEFCDHCPLN